LLVRSLGWVQLPSDKENMVADVTSALESMGVKYSIVRGELSDVFWVGNTPPTEPSVATPNLEAGGGDADADKDGPYSAGQLTVRIRVHHSPTSSDGSELHIDRHTGDVLQFHSFYRDVRNKLSGTNGWSQDVGRYTFDAREE